MRHLFALLLILPVLLGLTPAKAEEGKVDFVAVAAEISAKGNAAIKAYDPANGLDTADTFSDLYFEVFEGSGMEVAIGMQDGALKTELESYFGQVIGLATRGKPVEEIAKAWTILDSKLTETAHDFARQQDGGSTFWSSVIQSFLILTREGFEAILVVTALVAYMQRSGERDKVRYIYHGVGWALVASGITAWLMTSVFETSGASREALEGVTMLIAAGVLFYVSYWLFAKREAERWQAFIKNQIDKAASSGSVFMLAFMAFLAVYREGAETVLFYQALVAGADSGLTPIMIGFIAACFALGMIYAVMRFTAFKLPLTTFFTATAILLYYLAVVFAGKGILELQEARWVSITPVDWLPSIEWLGLFPTVESVAAQLALIIPAILALSWFAHKNRQRKLQNA